MIKELAQEKKYFQACLGLYAIFLLVALYFILAALSLGILDDFIFYYTLFTLIPLALTYLYFKKEGTGALRILICSIIIFHFAFTAYIILPVL